jgi:surface antigen
MKRFIAIFFAAALACGSALGQVAGGLLRGGPAELFDENDLRLFMDTAYQALDRPTGNEKFGFENPNTGHRGEVTVTRAFESRGRTCKEVQAHTEARGRKGDNKLYFCSVEGKWRLVGDSQL